jgi:gliding motility-associated-like protein
VSNSGVYTAYIIDANNCVSPNASITITVNANPIISNSFQIDTAYCNQLNGGIHQINISGGTSPYNYQWLLNNNLISTDSTLTNSGTGNYTYIIVDQYGCSDTAYAINIPSGNGIDISLISDIYQGYEPSDANLTSGVIAGNPINYSWFVNSTPVNGQNGNTLLLASLTQGTYDATIVANDNHGCYDTASVTIIIESQIKIIIPNVFTPNGDGTNDVFSITAEGLKDLKIDIYDRWGLLMYNQEGQSLSWDGKLTNGQLASDGTYYFLFSGKDIKGTPIEKQGYLTLIK